MLEIPGRQSLLYTVNVSLYQKPNLVSIIILGLLDRVYYIQWKFVLTGTQSYGHCRFLYTVPTVLYFCNNVNFQIVRGQTEAKHPHLSLGTGRRPRKPAHHLQRDTFRTYAPCLNNWAKRASRVRNCKKKGKGAVRKNHSPLIKTTGKEEDLGRQMTSALVVMATVMFQQLITLRTKNLYLRRKWEKMCV